MKVKSVSIRNVGKIEEADIEFNKPLLLFYGEIKQGKTTILNAIRFVFGGAFPSDIIRHGAEECSVCLTFDNGSITREAYRAKDGTTKARPIVFIRDGHQVEKPVAEIEKFLNPFLLDQDFLRNMSELERKRYLVELLGVDTSDLDEKIAALEGEARELRATIKAYGEINPQPVEPVDAEALEEELKAINEKHAAELAEVRRKNAEVAAHNGTVQAAMESREAWVKEILRLQEALTHAKAEADKADAFIKANPFRPGVPEPDEPDTSALKEKISNAKATNVRHEQYLKEKARAERKAIDQRELARLEKRLRELREEKLARLKSVSDNSRVPGLSFDESGEFYYEGTQAGMLSTSQLMKLSSDLSALYPAGFGLDLIDRGESLGRSIFDFVKRAQAEEKTILATIVGESPANVPEAVGVFVVEDGKIAVASSGAPVQSRAERTA